MKTVAVVVEGHGEVQAVPVLVRRIAAELGHGVKVPRPVRIRRNRVDRAGEFEKAVELASRDAGEEGSIRLKEVRCPEPTPRSPVPCTMALIRRTRSPFV